MDPSLAAAAAAVSRKPEGDKRFESWIRTVEDPSQPADQRVKACQQLQQGGVAAAASVLLEVTGDESAPADVLRRRVQGGERDGA